jgi:hypothetical protein
MFAIIPAIHACINTVKNTAIAAALTQNSVRLRFRRIFRHATVTSIQNPPRLYASLIQSSS